MDATVSIRDRRYLFAYTAVNTITICVTIIYSYCRNVVRRTTNTIERCARRRRRRVTYAGPVGGCLLSFVLPVHSARSRFRTYTGRFSLSRTGRSSTEISIPVLRVRHWIVNIHRPSFRSPPLPSWTTVPNFRIVTSDFFRAVSYDCD